MRASPPLANTSRPLAAARGTGVPSCSATPHPLTTRQCNRPTVRTSDRPFVASVRCFREIIALTPRAAGLIPLIFAYLEAIQCDPETWELMRTYMDFIQRRASGKLATAAKWMRHKVATHPAYKNDSIVPDEVAYDVVQACAAVAEGRQREPMLLGKQWIPPLRYDRLHVGYISVTCRLHVGYMSVTCRLHGIPPLRYAFVCRPRRDQLPPRSPRPTFQCHRPRGRTDDAYYVPLVHRTTFNQEERESLLQQYAAR